MRLTSAFRCLRMALLASALALSAGCGEGRTAAEAENVRDVLKATWQQEGLPLEVDPVVATGHYAVAGWTQGRALLEHREHGWEVLLCAGDLLRTKDGLASAGVPDGEAGHLSEALQDAERKASAARLAQMASFKGLARMGTAHATHMPGSAADSSQQEALQVHEAWSRATPEGATVGVVYLQIRNSGEADQLIGIRSSASETASLHKSRTEAAMVGMHAVPVLDIPRNTTIEFAPGGLHVMLTGLHRGLAQGEHFPLTLQFRSAGERQVEVNVAPMGAMGPAQPDAGGHEHIHN